MMGPVAVLVTVLVVTLVFRLVRAAWDRARREPVRDDVRARWDAAVTRHAETARAYAEFECDPAEVLARPALCDVTWPATARFVDAFAEASALHTETYPGAAAAAGFIRAADVAARAWTATRDAAERARWARFDAAERALLDQAVRLLDVAQESPFEEERRLAYARLARRLADLERRTGWAAPRPVTASLAARARPLLERGGGRHRRAGDAEPRPAAQAL
jgi:hypothetical protein